VKKKVTIRDVAAKLGPSAMAVSLALRAPRRVWSAGRTEIARICRWGGRRQAHGFDGAGRGSPLQLPRAGPVRL